MPVVPIVYNSLWTKSDVPRCISRDLIIRVVILFTWTYVCLLITYSNINYGRVEQANIIISDTIKQALKRLNLTIEII